MRYKIFENGEHINTIVSDSDFVESYCAENGYTYEESPLPTPEPVVPTPTTEERLADLESALAQTDETAIELFEAQEEQEEINAAQDEALIEIYELLEG